MYQDSKPRRRSGLGSGTRHGDSFWREESENTGLKLLTALGWQQGQGLGKEKQGTKNSIKAKLKSNNAGIGQQKKDEGSAFAAVTTQNFNELLKRLNENNSAIESSSSSLIASSSDSDSELNSSSTNLIGSVSRSIARRGLYGRFLLSKDVNKYSSAQKAEIFGKKSPTGEEEKTKISNETKNIQEENSSSLITTTSKISMTDYFKSKRAKSANNEIIITEKKVVDEKVADENENAEDEEERRERKRKRKEMKRAAAAAKLSLRELAGDENCD